MLHRARKLSGLLQGAFWFSDDDNRTLAYQLERRATLTPAHPFLRFEDSLYSYGQANALVNKHANAYRAMGVGRGDVVALVMENRPQLLWHIYGLHKLGAVASLINCHLSGQPLVHAVRICEPRNVVVGAEVWPAFVPAAHLLSDALPSDAVLVDEVPLDVRRSVGAKVATMQAHLQGASDGNPAESSQQRLGDLAAYIYTSGTTGLPKAACVRHERLFRAAQMWSTVALGLKPDDVLYNCLPLYHSNALMLATGSVVSAGATMALARKFSRSRFWEDICQHGATSFIYIGELCRYLANAPAGPHDRAHRVRVITGNGLREDVWHTMRERFGIGRIAEFYGATEGNCATLNIFNVPGSVGPQLPNMVLARWDEEAQEPARGRDGFLVKARPGELGLLLGRIRGRSSRFDGYRDKGATDRKIVRDAFKRGDAYFNSGDLLRVDRRRHLYFVDRVGDTFRWKGENVSAGEVQDQIASWRPVVETNAYGVRIPGTEGRAGMVSLRLKDGACFDPEAFKVHVDARLPAYARPLFVRLVVAMELTGTFKLRKVALQKEGFDPTAIRDPIYFRHPQSDRYVALDADGYSQIVDGRIRL